MTFKTNMRYIIFLLSITTCFAQVSPIKDALLVSPYGGKLGVIKPNEKYGIPIPGKQQYSEIVFQTYDVDTSKQYVLFIELREKVATPTPEPETPSILGNIDNVDQRNVYTGDWRAYNKSVFYNGTSQYTLVNGAVTVTFIGKRVEAYLERAKNHGIIGISILDSNGQIEIPEVLVDTYDNTTINNSQKVWTSPLLPPGTHKLVIRLTGQKNPLATDVNYLYDYLKVIE